MSTPVAAMWLRQVLGDALTDAITHRRDKYLFCGDCPKSPTDICPDHEEDDHLVAEYLTAAVFLQMADSDGELAAIMRGTDGSQS